MKTQENYILGTFGAKFFWKIPSCHFFCFLISVTLQNLKKAPNKQVREKLVTAIQTDRLSDG